VRYLSGKVRQRLRACGCESRIVSIRVLRELEPAIESRHQGGDLDERFYREKLSFFRFHPPDDLPEAKSLIVIAVPQPLVRATFVWNGRARQYIVPPTYDASVNTNAEDLLTRTLEPDGYRVAASALPLKLLAVRTGLAAYGKNNICFVQGMGSFHRLMAFYSDLPSDEYSRGDPTMLERCRKCSACIKACRTHAIDSDRFLLHAERCLTFLNEDTASFPDWVDPSWHHCLIGCMQCQTICPENKRTAQWVEAGPTFSEEETSRLLQGVSSSQAPSELAQKLDSLGLLEYLNILPRNLKVLLKHEPSRSNR
jgi:epoxyqueuosine reductase